MCGRYVSARKRLELLEEFAVERDKVAEDRRPDYNVAPTKQVYAVLERTEKDSGGSPKEQQKPERELRLLKWGLVPSWAKDSAGGARLINARAETVAVKPSFRSAFAKRRCIIPADGYYEWQAGADRKSKQPYYIYRSDGGILCFAGIYELWRDGSVPPDDESAWLWTTSIITTDATDEIGQIHDRTPMVIAPESWDDWLDPANNDKSLMMAMMAPATTSGSGGLTSHRVSTAVNSVRHNGPDLIEPLAPGTEPGAPAGDGASGHGEGSSLF
ncbi:MAG TPA: SOS response-associated peptidase [Trebonia sp.]|jgi:putative SOS response-associated peptidase YedK|nr:SOS response-associated peptidase [Trebonia sp.]